MTMDIGAEGLKQILKDADSKNLNRLNEIIQVQRQIFNSSIEDEVPMSLLAAFEICIVTEPLILRELNKLVNEGVLETVDARRVEVYYKNRIQDMRSKMESIIYDGLKAKYQHKHLE